MNYPKPEKISAAATEAHKPALYYIAVPQYAGYSFVLPKKPASWIFDDEEPDNFMQRRTGLTMKQWVILILCGLVMVALMPTIARMMRNRNNR